MKAMNGRDLLGKRARLFGCCAVAVLALAGLASAVPAGAVTPPVTTYIALGDSIAYGYTHVKFAENFPNEVPSYFEEGYASWYAKKLRANKEAPAIKGLVLVNNACPGETSGGLTGNLATNRYGEKEVECHYQTVLPMHNMFNGHSQLEDTIGILTTKNPVTSTTPAHPVEVISLNIGGNDELEGLALCEREVKEEFEAKGESKYGATPEGAVNGCLLTHLEEIKEKIGGNVELAGGGIRHYGYAGPLLILNGYNPNAILLPGSNTLVKIINERIEKASIAVGGTYVDVFAKVNPTTSVKAEQASICKYTEMCNPVAQALHEAEVGHALPANDGDIHPTLAGSQAIANLMYALVKA
jgi:hypothetical protein